MLILYLKQIIAFKIAKIIFRLFILNMKISMTEARNIHNLVRKNFPYESPWLKRRIEYGNFLERSKVSAKMTELIELQRKLSKQNELLDSVRESYQVFAHSPLNYFKELINAVRKYKVQNCGEAARIVYAVSRMNGVNDSDITISGLVTQKAKDYSKCLFPDLQRILDEIKEDEYGVECDGVIDHVVTEIQAPRGSSIVLDTILDECGEKISIEKIYKDKYEKLLQIAPDEEVRIVDFDYKYNQIPVLSNDDVYQLLEMYPELTLPEAKSSMPKRNKSFLNLFSLLKKKG